MLLGENLGGRHQRHLVAGLQRLQCGQRGDHRLAGADVALHQAQHGFGLGQVVGDLGTDPLLRAGGLEAEIIQIALRQRACRRQLRCLLSAHALAQALQRQLMGEQFFEGQAMLRPVTAFGEFVQIGIRRWSVQVADRLVQRAQVIVAAQLFRQPVGQAVRAEPCQRLLGELAQALLSQTFGGGVDGRQGLLDRRRLAVQGAVFGVVDFQPRGARAGFAETA